MALIKAKEAIAGFVRTNYGTDAPEVGRMIVSTPHGPMYAGPEYDRYARAENQLSALRKMVADASECVLTRDQALKVLTELDLSLIAHHDVQVGLGWIRARLEGDKQADSIRGFTFVINGLHAVEYSVGCIASLVPRPPDPLAVHPAKGQPLGTGAYHRSLND